MREFWRQWLGKRQASLLRGKARHPLSFQTLEGRQLLAITPGSVGGHAITASATPQILKDNGSLIPVMIHGTFHQGITTILSGNPKTPPPPKAMFYIQKNLVSRATTTPLHVEVTDQYRQYEPRIEAKVQLVKSSFTFYSSSRLYAANEQLSRDYTYTAIVYLQGNKNGGTNGRRYTISVSVSDADNGAGVNFSVVVPK